MNIHDESPFWLWLKWTVESKMKRMAPHQSDGDGRICQIWQLENPFRKIGRGCELSLEPVMIRWRVRSAISRTSHVESLLIEWGRYAALTASSGFA
jgi:hypothetical protein